VPGVENAGAEMDFTLKPLLVRGSRKQESAKRAWAQAPKTADPGNAPFCEVQGRSLQKAALKQLGGVTARLMASAKKQPRKARV